MAPVRNIRATERTSPPKHVNSNSIKKTDIPRKSIKSTQKSQEPDFLHLFLTTLPGEIRNKIYKTLTPLTWDWIDITQFKCPQDKFFLTHPLLAQEYHSLRRHKIQHTKYHVARPRKDRCSEVREWRKWLENFNDEARCVRVVHFRTFAFPVKVILEEYGGGEKLKIRYEVRGKGIKEVVGLQRRLNVIAASEEGRKMQLERVAVAVVECAWECKLAER